MALGGNIHNTRKKEILIIIKSKKKGKEEKKIYIYNTVRFAYNEHELQVQGMNTPVISSAVCK